MLAQPPPLGRPRRHRHGRLRVRLRLRRDRRLPGAVQEPGRRLGHGQRLDAHRAELVEPEMVPRPSRWQRCLPRPARRPGPYAANPKLHTASAATTPGGQRGERRVGGHQPRARGRRCSWPTPQALVAYWHKLGRRPHAGSRHHVGQRLRPRHHAARRHRRRSPWCRMPPASPRRPCARSSPTRPMGGSSASSAAPTSTSSQLNEALAKLK